MTIDVYVTDKSIEILEETGFNLDFHLEKCDTLYRKDYEQTSLIDCLDKPRGRFIYLIRGRHSEAFEFAEVDFAFC